MLTTLASLSFTLVRESQPSRRGAAAWAVSIAMTLVSVTPTGAETIAAVRVVGASSEQAAPAHVEFLTPFNAQPALPPIVGVEAKTQAEAGPWTPPFVSPAVTVPPALKACAKSASTAPRVASNEVRITRIASMFTPLPVLQTAAAEPVTAKPVVNRRIYRPITQLTVEEALLPPGALPNGDERSAASRAQTPEFGDARQAGAWADAGFEWAASCMCHGPLYFEEVNLERHGYGCHPWLQPAVSSAHFFLTVPALPYKMATQCPGECIYTLGYYRPGSCVPWQRNWPPCSIRGGIAETATVAGLILLIP